MFLINSCQATLNWKNNNIDNDKKLIWKINFCYDKKLIWKINICWCSTYTVILLNCTYSTIQKCSSFTRFINTTWHIIKFLSARHEHQFLPYKRQHCICSLFLKTQTANEFPKVVLKSKIQTISITLQPFLLRIYCKFMINIHCNSVQTKVVMCPVNMNNCYISNKS